MKKTIRDLEKVGNSSVKWLKNGIYYLYLPTILILGLKTVKWEAFFPAASGINWSNPA